MHEASKVVADEIVKNLLKKQKEGKPFVMGICGGASPQHIYEELVRRHKEENISFRNLVVFNIYEYYPITDSTQSNLQMLKDIFWIISTSTPRTSIRPIRPLKRSHSGKLCGIRRGARIVRRFGLFVVGLGSKGNIGFNMPGSNPNSRTRLRNARRRFSYATP